MTEDNERARALGERRHEVCRWGTLTPAYRIYADDPDAVEHPDVIPLCTWKLPDPHPPGVRRAWGGDVDFVRDCAACPCFEELTAQPRTTQ